MKCVIGDADFADVEPLMSDQQMITSNISLPQELANVSCGSFTQTETDFAKKLYEAERDVYAKKKADLEEARDQVDSQLTEVIAWFAAFNGTTQAAQIILTSVHAAYSAAAAVPEIIACACGLASGVSTKVDASKPVRAALEAAQSILSTIISTGQITQANINEINSMKQRLTQLRQVVAELDLDKALKARALVDTHFQLAGRLAQGAEDIKELALQGSMAAVDCQSQDLGIDEQVARLKSDHERILAGLDLQARENDLLSFQITDQQRTIDRLTNEIAILNLELDKLSLSEAQLNQDNARIAELVAATNSRIDRVRAAQTTVTGLAEESNASTNLINELRDRQSQKMLALNDAELAFVEQRITQSRGNTEELVAGLNQAKDLGLKSRALQDSILKFQSNVQAEVTKQQADMTKLVTQIDDPATRKNLFIATQDTVADLMKGIPEYLVTKRRVLETANRLMHLMRRRFEVVQAFTGEAATVPVVYVRNATQLQAMIDDIVAKRFFDERQINIDVAQIVVPANSGFARKLALDENVEFEVSPFASTNALMKANGYFALWAPNKFRERKNLTLIDVFVGTDYQCTGTQWNRFALQHRGSGFVFKPLTKGVERGPRRHFGRAGAARFADLFQPGRQRRRDQPDHPLLGAGSLPGAQVPPRARTVERHQPDPALSRRAADRLVPPVAAAERLPVRRRCVHPLFHLRERAVRAIVATAALGLALGATGVGRARPLRRQSRRLYDRIARSRRSQLRGAGHCGRHAEDLRARPLRLPPPGPQSRRQPASG